MFKVGQGWRLVFSETKNSRFPWQCNLFVCVIMYPSDRHALYTKSSENPFVVDKQFYA